jgi:hypothetical protein
VRRLGWSVLAALLTATSPVLAQGSGHIVFDLSHEESHFSDPYEYTLPTGWGPTMDLLVASGYTWSPIPVGGSITPEALAGAGVLIVAEPLTSFTPTEVETVLDYVRNGGGLLLLNDFNAPINELSAPTGVQFLLGPSSGFATTTEIVAGHPVTAGIVEIDLPIATPLLVGTEATPLAYYLGTPIMAVQEYGSGRIVYVGDNELFAIYGINDLDNAALLHNVLNWLGADSDRDGVKDGDDLCPGTVSGPVNADGCSYDQLEDAACPKDGCYRNHGAYVACVAHIAQEAYKDGLISKAERNDAVRAAAHSDIGKGGCPADDDDDDDDKKCKKDKDDKDKKDKKGKKDDDDKKCKNPKKHDKKKCNKKH